MLRKITTGFAAAMRLIAAENINALRNFAKDASGLFCRLRQMQKASRLREDEGTT